MMGSRSGDVDPAISLYLQQHYAMTAEKISDDLTYQSGLLAIAGSADMRQVLSQREQGEAWSTTKQRHGRAADLIIIIGCIHAFLGFLELLKQL